MKFLKWSFHKVIRGKFSVTYPELKCAVKGESYRHTWDSDKAASEWLEGHATAVAKNAARSSRQRPTHQRSPSSSSSSVVVENLRVLRRDSAIQRFKSLLDQSPGILDSLNLNNVGCEIPFLIQKMYTGHNKRFDLQIWSTRRGCIWCRKCQRARRRSSSRHSRTWREEWHFLCYIKFFLHGWWTRGPASGDKGNDPWPEIWIFYLKSVFIKCY